MKDETINRREFIIRGAAATLAGTTAFSLLSAAKPRTSPMKTKPSDFSFIHLTDIHVRYKRKGDVGYQKCISTIKELKQKPDLAIMGGDLAFDGNYTDKAEFIRSIELYKTISDEMGIPYYNCLGNHDHLGYSSRRKCAPDDPEIGKKCIMDRLGMKDSYYSFDHKGWHFVILDSAYPIETPTGPSQAVKLGKEQLEWLAYDLGAHHGMPTVACIHVAAFCEIGTHNGDKEFNPIKSGMVIEDTRELQKILERHKVKALLQGHGHMTEEYGFNGVWYITTQSAGACWWAGEWLGFKPGYTVFHCHGDQLTWDRVTYELDYYLEPEDDLERKLTAQYKESLKEQAELLQKEIAGKK